MTSVRPPGPSMQQRIDEFLKRQEKVMEKWTVQVTKKDYVQVQ